MKYWGLVGCRLLFKVPSTYVDTLQSAAVWRQRDPDVPIQFFTVWPSYIPMAHTRQRFSKVYPALKYTYLRSQRELGAKSDI